MELSENLKSRSDSAAGQQAVDSRVSDAELPGSAGRVLPGEDAAGSGQSGSTDEAESQMRKALGLLGETQRHRPDTERAEQPARLSDRFSGGVHRRRFVQDGDVPVTVLRRDPAHETPAHRGGSAPQAPTSSRLHRTEAALAAETAARDRVERLLAETQALVRDLQTKIGHAELAKTEALAALRQEKEAIAQLRADGEAWHERHQETLERVNAAERSAQVFQEELADERAARKAVEKTRLNAEAARDTAEQLVRTLSEQIPADPLPEPLIRRSRAVAEPEVSGTMVRRGRPHEPVAAEPEPVKWWLNTKQNGKRR